MRGRRKQAAGFLELKLRLDCNPRFPSRIRDFHLQFEIDFSDSSCVSRIAKIQLQSEISISNPRRSRLASANAVNPALSGPLFIATRKQRIPCPKCSGSRIGGAPTGIVASRPFCSPPDRFAAPLLENGRECPTHGSAGDLRKGLLSNVTGLAGQVSCKERHGRDIPLLFKEG
jgi:hypothetical protein